LYCATHKLDGMIDIKNKIAEILMKSEGN
jgi:hypothetical protein